MANKFANILGFLGLGSDKEAVTEAHLEAADTKIAQLEAAKTAAEQQATTAATDLATAQASLKTATDNLTKAATDLKAAEEKATTLEKWKAEQKAVDNREEDDSNDLDKEDDGPKAGWEVAGAEGHCQRQEARGREVGPHTVVVQFIFHAFALLHN